MSDFQKIYMRRFGTSTISSTLATSDYFELTVAQTTTQSISTYTPTDLLNNSESFEELYQLTCLSIGIFFCVFLLYCFAKKIFVYEKVLIIFLFLFLFYEFCTIFFYLSRLKGVEY
jgi:hypothetical protein